MHLMVKEKCSSSMECIVKENGIKKDYKVVRELLTGLDIISKACLRTLSLREKECIRWMTLCMKGILVITCSMGMVNKGVRDFNFKESISMVRRFMGGWCGRVVSVQWYTRAPSKTINSKVKEC